MPLYEYACRACGSGFERRRKFEEREAPVSCPQCGAPAEAILSAHAVVSASSSPRSGSGAAPGFCCGGGACGLN